MNGTALFENLETRTLLSATATGKVFDPTVAEDRLAVRIDLLKFRIDLATTSATLLADVAAIKANDAGQAATLTPLFKQLHTDVKAMVTTLAGDRLNDNVTTLGDELTIAKELVKAHADRGNATAEAADQTALQADRAQLQTDLIAGLDARIATREADYTTIFNDVGAIVTAVQNDTDASPALVKAIDKFSTDRTARLNAITTDLQTLVTARTKLATDLAAET